MTHLTPLTALQKNLRVSLMQARLLLVLARTELVTLKLLRDELEVAKNPRVMISRLRKAVSKSGIEILSQRGVGYWVSADSRAKIVQATKNLQMDLPMDFPRDPNQGTPSDAEG